MGLRLVFWSICYFLFIQSVTASPAHLGAGIEPQDLFELKWSFTEFQPEGQKLPAQKPTDYQQKAIEYKKNKRSF